MGSRVRRAILGNRKKKEENVITSNLVTFWPINITFPLFINLYIQAHKRE